MVKDVDAVDAEDTLGLLDDRTMLREAFEERAKVGFVICLVFAGDKDVVKIDEDVLEALRDPIREVLEGLSGVLQSEKRIQMNSHSPNGVLMAVLVTSSVDFGICMYPYIRLTIHFQFFFIFRVSVVFHHAV